MGPTINITTPAKWKAQGFWAWRKRRAFGLVLAFCPTMFSFGGELIVGESKGAALIAGPFWLGFATLRIDQDPRP
jgi:hypothetical protein